MADALARSERNREAKERVNRKAITNYLAQYDEMDEPADANEMRPHIFGEA